MTKHLKFPPDDPTSTSSTYGHPKVKEIYQQVVQATQQAQMQSLQQQAQHHFGQSIVSSQAQEIFKEKIQEEVKQNDRAEEFHGLDYKKMQDAFHDALYSVRKNHGNPDDYSWYIHPETQNLIRDLYDFLSRVSASMPSDDALRENMVMMGVPFISDQSVPQGWLLLAQEDALDNNPIRPHPMALIREIDAGFQESVEMDIGGQIYFRVINA